MFQASGLATRISQFAQLKMALTIVLMARGDRNITTYFVQRGE
jgi:hypothetical protein